MLSRRIALAVVLLFAGAARAQPSYRIAQTVSAGGMEVSILEDTRLTPDLARKLRGVSTDPGFVLGDDDPVAKVFAMHPLRPAKLRQTDAAGRVVRDVILEAEAPLAWIEPQRLGDRAHPILLVTSDDSAGFGSYSGFGTRLYAFEGGRLSPVTALGATGRNEIISLAKTLKSDWRIVDARPEHTVIHELLCRPDSAKEKPDAPEPFVLSFITYAYGGRIWRVAARKVPGFWESEGEWSKAAKFPEPGGR